MTTNEIKLPKSWDDVYAYQFVAIKAIENNDFGFFLRHIEILSILTDTLSDDEVWDDIDVEELSSHIKSLSWLKKEPNTNHSYKIGELTYKGLNNITLGEFIDMGIFISKSELFNACAVMYRKTKVDEWGNIDYEPYGKYNLQERSLLFEELPITQIYGIVPEFNQFQEMITSTYTNIFVPQNIDDEIDESLFDEVELEEMKKEREEEAEKSAWSWEFIIYEMTDGDLEKTLNFTDLPLIFVLNQMSFRKRFKSE